MDVLKLDKTSIKLPPSSKNFLLLILKTLRRHSTKMILVDFTSFNKSGQFFLSRFLYFLYFKATIIKGSKGMRQLPINWCTFPMMLHKITSSVY